MNELANYRQIRLDKLTKITELGYKPYPSEFNKSHNNKELAIKYKDLAPGEETNDEVTVAGRIMSMRNNGMFIDLHDCSDKIQIFSHEKNLNEVQLELLNNLDLGDIIGIKGKIRCTPRNELTINSLEIELLSKALLPLPEKYHGLTDVETRYRQRYVDLIMNHEVRETFKKRSKIITTIRNHLIELDYLEVETPMLHPIPGGAIAKPFVTHHNALDSELYLRIAPELYLKKLIIGGLSEKIFEINRCFRNEGISTRHNPEFTSVEIYCSYVDYQKMMSLTEELISRLVNEINQDYSLQYGEHNLNFTSPWQRKSMSDLVKEATGIDFMQITCDEESKRVADELGVKIQDNYGWGRVLEAIFAQKVEANLINPIHVTHLPTEISPLAKICDHDSRITERFETYINGWEIANGFSELNDPIDQYDRFNQQLLAEDDSHRIDEDFINALEHAMPPLGGLGIGIDRLVMILTNNSSIRDVIAFPTLRAVAN